jgi:histidyl-tRNA synthetase
MGGGGRYDNMVGKFSGRDVPACGFSIGFERIIGVLLDNGTKPKDAKEKLALIFDPDRDKTSDVMKAAEILRNKGFSVSAHPRKKDMRKQLDAFVQHDFSKFVAFKGEVDNLEIKPLGK